MNLTGPDPTFRVRAVNGWSMPLEPHNCGQVCPSCGDECRIAWSARTPRRYKRKRATVFHYDRRGHLW